jgi:polo-like kinase 1
MSKKTTLMLHFRGYLIETEPVTDITYSKVYVKKWMKAKHAIIFRLSDKTV